MLKKLLSPALWSASAPDQASLVLRLGFGGLLALTHGHDKFHEIINGATDFPDLLHIGSYPTFIGAVATEFFCSILLVLGLFTRPAALALIFSMTVIAFIAHAADPLADKEHALLYWFCYVGIFLLGAGRYSVDFYLKRNRS